jgi:hypothetical protein
LNPKSIAVVVNVIPPARLIVVAHPKSRGNCRYSNLSLRLRNRSLSTSTTKFFPERATKMIEKQTSIESLESILLQFSEELKIELQPVIERKNEEDDSEEDAGGGEDVFHGGEGMNN